MKKSDLLKQFGITNLCHFTNIKNLESILMNGIMPISKLIESDIKFYNSDKNRFDQKENAISLSFQNPNVKMLYQKENNFKMDINIWVIFELKNELLDDSNLKTYFCKQNASSKEMKQQLREEINYLMSIDALLETLQENNDQKEILVEGIIPIHYIDKIYAKNISDCDLVRILIQKNNINIPVVCNSSLYKTKW